MVLGAPLVSLRGFASTRPPLIVFTLCITAFALTTLWLAYFVRTEEQFKSADVNSYWKTFLEYLNVQELCLQPNGDTGKISGNDTLELTNSSVNVVATLHLAVLPANISYVQGFIVVSGWTGVCATANPQDALLGVSFGIDHNMINRSENIPQEVCITLTGPRSLLPPMVAPSACSSALHTSQGNIASLTSRKSPPALGERVDSWCPEGNVVRLSYKINPENSVVLSLSDRSIINLHLVHTSYFLFVMAITLICYAVIRGKPKNKTLLDKVPLEL